MNDKHYFKLDFEEWYQGCATRGGEEVEDGGQVIVPNQDQSETDQVQKPVDHVEPHCN